MYRMPWWIRKYLRQVFKVDVATAAEKRKYWSFAYLVTCFVAFNYSLVSSHNKGFSKEDGELLTEAEKVVMRLNIRGAQHVKLTLGGETEVSEIGMDHVQKTLEERKKMQRLNLEQASDEETLLT